MKVKKITELPSFTKKAELIFNSAELVGLREFIRQHPERGDMIPSTGGLRKLRWASGGKGKRGGARAIYYYHIAGFHIYLMACYAKNEQEDLRPEVKKQLSAFVKQIKQGV